MKKPESKPGILIKSYAKLGNLLQQLASVSGITANCKVLVAVSNFSLK